MTSPALSVLMTVYQGASFLPATLDSVLTQTFTDFEFIALDDGSTDGTGAILEAYAARDARLRVLHNPVNQGTTSAMNQLFPLARGRYVTRHDADDLSVRERFAQQVAFLDANPDIGMVSSLIGLIGSDGATLDEVRFASGNDHEAILERLYDYNCLCQGSVMFRRQCREAVGLYDENIRNSEDYDYWLRMVEITRVVKLPVQLYIYRDHQRSVSHQHYGKTQLGKAVGLEKALRRRFGASPPDRLVTLVARDYLDAAEHLQSEADTANQRLSLAGVLRHRPEWFESDAVSIPIPPTPAGERLAQDVFAEIASPTERQRRLASFLARQHMREVFTSAARGDWARVGAHLGPAVRQDPAWLLNRGVWSLSARALAWRLGHRGGLSRPG
jgi:glycosyltransferase involved in cell wall biosynthesis